MAASFPPLESDRLKVFPLAQRRSLSRVEAIVVDPAKPPPPCPPELEARIAHCADCLVQARSRGASVLLIYGAHLLRNGAVRLLEGMMRQGWLTHLATNGAGTIHDWEFAFAGRSTEDVRANVATGTFGTWDETGRFIHLALHAGGIALEGYGQALGRFIQSEVLALPEPAWLEEQLRRTPGDPRAGAWADLLFAMKRHQLSGGTTRVPHPWKEFSILAQAFRHGLPLTAHPGIGYDIISNHPFFDGAVIGRAATIDFRRFAGAVAGLDGGVVLSVGSAIMGPQVFEKSLSCVNNLRLQAGRAPVADHSIFVVDLQDGGQWDWTRGEPPKTHPAYYLRFCKSYARMGGTMHYLQCDNLLFLRHLNHQLHRHE